MDHDQSCAQLYESNKGFDLSEFEPQNVTALATTFQCYGGGCWVIVFLCTNGDLIFVHCTSQEDCFVCCSKILPSAILCSKDEICAFCLGNWNKRLFLLCMEVSGSVVIIVPVSHVLKHLNDSLCISDCSVPLLFAENEVTEFSITSSFGPSNPLSRPTAMTWFEDAESMQPFLLFGNKSGDICVVDLRLRVVTACIQTPQSVDRFYLMRDDLTSWVHLLIRGSFGTEWLFPLKKKSMSVRETLSEIVLPKQLMKLDPCSSCFPVLLSTGSHSFVQFDSFRQRFQFSNSIDMSTDNVMREVQVNSKSEYQSQCHAVAITRRDKVLFAVLNNRLCGFLCSVQNVDAEQLLSGTSPHQAFGVFSAVYESSGDLGIILDLIPVNSSHDSSTNADCFLLCSKGFYVVRQNRIAVFEAVKALLLSASVCDIVAFCNCMGLDIASEFEQLLAWAIENRQFSALIKVAKIIEMPYSLLIEKITDPVLVITSLNVLNVERINLSVEENKEVSSKLLSLFTSLLVQQAEDSALFSSCLRRFIRTDGFYDPEDVLAVLVRGKHFSDVKQLVTVHNLELSAISLLLQAAESGAQETFLDVVVFTSMFCSSPKQKPCLMISLVLVHRLHILEDVIDMISRNTFHCRRLLLQDSNLCRRLVVQVERHLESYKLKDLLCILSLCSPNTEDMRLLLQSPASSNIVSVAGIVTLYLKALLLVHEVRSRLFLRSHHRKNSDHFTSMKHSSIDFLPVACGYNHSLLISSDSGNEQQQQLCWWGDLTRFKQCDSLCSSTERYVVTLDVLNHVLKPTPVNINSTFAKVRMVQVSCGAEHNLCISDSGQLFAFGNNKFGQLGVGDLIARHQPSPLTTAVSYGVPVFTKVCCGAYHSAAIAILDNNEIVFTWGWSLHGQLGHRYLTDDQLVPRRLTYFVDQHLSVVDVACGYAHSIFLTKCGKLYACGSGLYGLCGFGHKNKTSVPNMVSFASSDDPFGEGQQFVARIGAGYFTNLAVVLNSTTGVSRLFTWGSSPQSLKLKYLSHKRKLHVLSKQNNESDKETVSSEAAVAEPPTLDFSCYENDHLKPAVVDSSAVHGNIERLCCGLQHWALLTDEGKVYGWGRWSGHQPLAPAGREKSQPCSTPALVTSLVSRRIISLALGAEHSIAVDSGGNVFGWGRNDRMQIPDVFITATSESSLKKQQNKQHTVPPRTFVLRGVNRQPRTIRFPVSSADTVSTPQRITTVTAAVEIQDWCPENEVVSLSEHLDRLKDLLQQLAKFCRHCNRQDLVEFAKRIGWSTIASWLLLTSKDNSLNSLKFLMLGSMKSEGIVTPMNALSQQWSSNSSNILDLLPLNFEVFFSRWFENSLSTSSCSDMCLDVLWNILFSGQLENAGVRLLMKSNVVELNRNELRETVSFLINNPSNAATDASVDAQSEVPEEKCTQIMYVFSCGHVLSRPEIINSVESFCNKNNVLCSVLPASLCALKQTFCVSDDNYSQSKYQFDSSMCPECIMLMLLRLDRNFNY